MKKAKMIFNVELVVFGAIALIFGRGDSFFSGCGTALICVGVLRLLDYIRYVKNPEYAKKVEIENTDERNLQLSMKAQSFAFWTGNLLLVATMIILRIMKLNEYSTMCGYILCVFLLIYAFAYRIYRKTC